MWRPRLSLGEPLEPEPGDTEAAGIEAEFQQKLAGLRRLRPQERALALRMAQDARTVALRLLQQRQALRRAERRVRNQLKMPTPR